ncbi:MAG: hypothetical protein ACYCPQ_10550 [Elusimicrobiota bacterium]
MEEDIRAPLDEPAYRPLDYELRLYGFWPHDLAAVAVILGAAIGLVSNILWTFVIVLPFAALAWRGRKRRSRFLRSFLGFISAPAAFGVGHCREKR